VVARKIAAFSHQPYGGASRASRSAAATTCERFYLTLFADTAAPPWWRDRAGSCVRGLTVTPVSHCKAIRKAEKNWDCLFNYLLALYPDGYKCIRRFGSWLHLRLRVTERNKVLYLNQREGFNHTGVDADLKLHPVLCGASHLSRRRESMAIL
jgi:hypothetical protein